MRRLTKGALVIAGTLAALLVIGVFVVRERGEDTHILTTAQVLSTAAATSVPAPTATTPARPSSSPHAYRGVALGGREDNAEIREWIDQMGTLGHGENSYDHWVSLGKPRDTAKYPTILQESERRVLTDALIRLERISPRELAAKRQRLIEFIWKEAGFPSVKHPHAIAKDFSDSRFALLDDLASVQRIEVLMEFGVNSVIYLFRPHDANGQLLIYHQGHDGGFLLGLDTIHFFVQHGYVVAAFAMPLLGMNGRPSFKIPDGTLALPQHGAFQFLESDAFSPLKFFIEPVAVFLNYALEEYDYDSVAMVGLSGGGWTTTLAAALDPRIARSYPVAGSLPLFFASARDYEQTHPGFYALANYLELYVLGTYGGARRQIQVLNRYDPCCFDGTGYRLYVDQVARTSERVGNGSFSVFLDETHREHKISEAALALILNDLERP